VGPESSLPSGTPTKAEPRQTRSALGLQVVEVDRRADPMPHARHGDDPGAIAEAGATTIAVAAHPGITATELGRNAQLPVRIGMRLLTPFMQRPDAGALPTLRAATEPGVGGGQYYGPSGLGEARGHPVLVTSSPDSHDAAVQARLWTVSEELTGVRFPALIDRH